MIVSLDCEFTELSQNGELISIGLIAENGKKFYAEFLDFKPFKIEDNLWMLQNVIGNLKYIKLSNVRDYWTEFLKSNNTDIMEYEKIHIQTEQTFEMEGTRYSVKRRLQEWLKSFDYVEILADCGHFDFTFFISLFGTAFDLPDNVCPSYIELNNLISKRYRVNEFTAFNTNREELIKNSHIGAYVSGQHNSLVDAINQLTLYNILAIA